MHHEIHDAAAGTVWIAGVLGPRGDAYAPADAPSTAEAAHYYAEQADALARAGADFLFAATLPAVPEAIGVARALEATAVPAVISFVLDIDGVAGSPPLSSSRSATSTPAIRRSGRRDGRLGRRLRVPILGGCSGTDDRHLCALATLLH